MYDVLPHFKSAIYRGCVKSSSGHCMCRDGPQSDTSPAPTRRTQSFSRAGSHYTFTASAPIDSRRCMAHALIRPCKLVTSLEKHQHLIKEPNSRIKATRERNQWRHRHPITRREKGITVSTLFSCRNVTQGYSRSCCFGSTPTESSIGCYRPHRLR